VLLWVEVNFMYYKNCSIILFCQRIVCSCINAIWRGTQWVSMSLLAWNKQWATILTVNTIWGLINYCLKLVHEFQAISKNYVKLQITLIIRTKLDIRILTLLLTGLDLSKSKCYTLKSTLSSSSYSSCMLCHVSTLSLLHHEDN